MPEFVAGEERQSKIEHLSDELPPETYLTLEEVQKQLKRSRATIYRYTNVDPVLPNPPYNPKLLNPEVRASLKEPLQFHPKEVRRFAEEVLGLNVVLKVQASEETTTHALLKAILAELQALREQLGDRP